MLQWVKSQGGVEEMERRTNMKSRLVYDAIDDSDGFYCSGVDRRYRSRIVIPFRIGGLDGDRELEKKFLAGCYRRRMVSLNGHWRVGGVRASLYNAVTIEEVAQLAQYMRDFCAENRQ